MVNKDAVSWALECELARHKESRLDCETSINQAKKTTEKAEEQLIHINKAIEQLTIALEQHKGVTQ